MLLGAVLCATAACSDFKLPRLTDPPPPQTTIPANVTLVFHDSVRTATLEETVCADTLWRGQLGNDIVKTFQESGRARFAQVTVAETEESPRPSSLPSASHITAAVNLAKASLKSRTRSGSEDNYVSQIEIQLGASFQDANGQSLGETPLVYSEQVKLWTPQFGGSGQCATQQLDEVMHTAVEQLAGQLIGYVAIVTAKTHNQAIASQPAPDRPLPPQPPSMPPPPTPSVAAAQPDKTASTVGGDQNRYAVIVGLGLYRSPWPGWKTGLTPVTKETVSLFAQSLNVLEAQTLLLQDELAGQTDIEEALGSWLPQRVTKDSIVFFYFAGHAVSDQKNGEVFLLPYDATPASSPFRLISIRFLQSRLQKLGAKLVVAIIDSPLTVGGQSKEPKLKTAPVNWTADLDGASRMQPGTVMQVSRLPGASHPQETLLTGLAGSADLDHDGFVTVGEWLRSLRGTAVTVPTLPPSLAVQSIPLTQVKGR